METGKSSSLWVEDATSAYEENHETRGTFFYGANRRKTNTGSGSLWNLYLGETVHICNVKTIMVFSYQDIKNGNQIIIQKQV
jgi:hypothetical protein